ncbi:glycosyl hydrolase family 61-domain-containing protein [Podospora aff. communis PSN243]|uniref:lytic cellulose monooxygenase (C4-dehydrogenating) n=1 Tax=Podospora aff. communis PSN243 TaxID=3040156 RepID=A0AAV9GB33_9PEZI|nr:glycosyl hydrolase family 61-domain-containing protein [Podospora aff. communis PSN243]
MQFSLAGIALWALAAANTAEAHYRFSKLLINGRLTNDFEYIRENSNGIMPTKEFLTPSDDFRCNSGSFNNAQRTKVAKVMPGDRLGFQLWYYATMQHPGPLTIHMSKAPGDVRNYRGEGDWFKVHQMIICKEPTGGYLNDKDWCTWDKSTVEFTIPRDTPPGQYLVRVEHIAIHGAKDAHTEFYFECAQIEVGGNGQGRPGPMVKIPGLYNREDPALRFFIYGAPRYPYTNVGQHAVWTGGNSGGGSSPPPATNPPPNNGGGNNGGAAPLWGQCGGNGWTGPTRCAEGTCKYSNDWYSQCQK